MDSAYVKALAALQPFVHLADTTKNPSNRFIADLITRATSASGTYFFTELLQLPAVQSLRAADTAPEYRAYLTILELFSWGTIGEHKSEPDTLLLLTWLTIPGSSDLPPLTEAQTLKLQQLSLLSIASPFLNSTSTENTLTYSHLISALSLSGATALESLVTSCIYANLLTARLSPTSTPPTVHITAVAPLRDLRPQSLPALLQILSTWSSRCDATIADLESKINTIKVNAIVRNTSAQRHQDVIDNAVINVVADEKDTDKQKKSANTGKSTRLGSKRDLDEEAAENSDDMDVDEGIGEMGAGFVGGSSGIPSGMLPSGRGTKRNRGRG
jgi:COP9 signalosome complex subunit 7